MAKRRTRRIIIDRLEAAIRFLDQAEDRLANASSIYYENGAKEGALLDQINDSVRTLRDTVRDFRYTRA